MSTILTHERINLGSGVLLPQKGILWGQNALQSLTVGRHTPKNPQQAVGHLGIVDYTSGAVTSDAQLETILVEACDAAVANSSVYKYAAQQITIGSETFVLTSASVGFQSGSPATAAYGWLTSGLASYLDVQAAPAPESGEESSYCIVMGDDGNGLILVPTWNGSGPTIDTAGIPIINADGTSGHYTDSGVPAGVQSLNFQSTINRDQVLDIRSSSPIQFVTTYPVDVTMAMEVYCLPGGPGTNGYDYTTFVNQFRNLTGLAVKEGGLTKHLAATSGGLKASSNKNYVDAIGLIKTDESEAISVGRYLAYTLNFTAADLRIPAPAIS